MSLVLISISVNLSALIEEAEAREVIVCLALYEDIVLGIKKPAFIAGFVPQAGIEPAPPLLKTGF